MFVFFLEIYIFFMETVLLKKWVIFYYLDIWIFFVYNKLFLLMIIKWEKLWYDICNWDNNDGDDNNNICDDNWDNNNIDDIDNGCCGFDNVDRNNDEWK